ncbi:MAG: YgaP family membrane protein [Rhizobiaceae bacterium]
MKRNVGLIDRSIRVWLGIAMIFFALVSPETPFSFLGWLGIIPLVTGLTGRCAIYKLIGISTAR